MRLQAIAIDTEDSSYDRKGGGKVLQISVIAGDRSQGRRLKDNVECIFSGDDLETVRKFQQDTTFECEVSEIRVGFGARMRLTAHLPKKEGGK